MKSIPGVCAVLCCALNLVGAPTEADAASDHLKLLFLGDRGPHQPAARARELLPVLAARGIEITYTEDVGELRPDRLKQFAGLILYANIDEITPKRADALLNYVNEGGAFIPLHCASYCFRNNPEIVALIGAQFSRHGTGVFRVGPTPESAAHPLMHGYRGFESWDETYVHTLHNDRDRTVLEYRVEGDHREPWTWVRTHGQGRVFYTAWGHDSRTWSHPGFHNLVERGIRWACRSSLDDVLPYADRPEMTPKRTDARPLEYVEATIPFYPPNAKWGTLAEPVKKMQQPLPAEESLKHFVTPVGFRVELFAAEPEIGKPLAMNWDERGRLWLCETLDYPNELRPRGQGRDRIRICEDTDGDGRADKFTIFAEQLSIPTAITFYRGGAIVQDGTQTVYLRDTDGDDRADVRETLITGWALDDTHGGVSNFHYGVDNWFYAMQGYNNSEPVYDRGTKKSQRFRMGFFRFKVVGGTSAEDPVRVSELEFLRSTNNNTWGLGFSEEGFIFGSTANGNPSEFLPIPNRYYERVRGWSAGVLNGIADDNHIEPIMETIRQVDHHGGFTAGTGHALYTARAWPREYWNRTAFVCEPTGHLVATFVIRPDGAGFRSRNSWNILASDDEWSAPIMAEVGPDGQLWVIDWYNLIVQHNPTPAGYKTGRGNAYETDLRDKRHGRVYRVVYGGDPATPAQRTARQSLRDVSPEDLVAALQDDNLFWRRTAQRLLVENGPSAAIDRSLSTLIAGSGTERSPESVLHAIWTLAGRGVSWHEHFPALLADRAAGVRRAALLAADRDDGACDQLLNSDVLKDVSPQVRLAALLALAEMPASEPAGTALAAIVERPEVAEDRWLRDGLTAAAAAHDVFFLQALLRADRPVATASSSDSFTRDLAARIAEHAGRGGQPNAVPTLLRSLAASQDATLGEAILTGLAAGWPREQTVKLELSPADEEQLVAAFQASTPRARASLVMLAARWGTKSLEKHAAEISAKLLEQVRDENRASESRIDSAIQLMTFRPSDSAAAGALLEMLSPRISPDMGEGLWRAIGLSDSVEVGSAVIERLPALTPSLRAAGLRVVLSRSEWLPQLLDALEQGRLQLSDLALDQKQALASHPQRNLAARAKRLMEKGGGLPNPDRQKVIDELLPLTRRTADAVAGKEVFKKQCAKCHTHGGEGNKIGPDLTGMAVHPKHELLIHLIDPSRSVEGNFRVYTVALADGRVLTGLLASESKTAIELVDAEAKRHSLLREDIEELVVSTKSLMPEGFEKQVPASEIADLLEFLTQRGKFLPLPLDKVATVVSTQGMFYSAEANAERLIFSDWSPKTFEGIPFVLVDPQGTRQPNVVMLHGPLGAFPPRMPRTVTLPCNAPAKAIHLLSGISGWGYPAQPKGGVSVIVRLHYADGEQEEHRLINGEHFADYIRRVDVPGSKFAFALRGQQVRHLAVHPRRSEPIAQIEFAKGDDATAPVIMAVTVESP